MENSKIMKLMFSKIKKIKSISIKRNEKINKIKSSGLLNNISYKKKNSKYNLIIICTGANSKLVKSIFNDQYIQNSYEEVAISVLLKHQPIKNNIVRQIFLNDEILALLPISNNKTSIVWTIKKKNKKKNIFYKNKIKFYAGKFLKRIKFINKIEYRNLNFLIRSQYYKERTLLFGDALHLVHPLAGQGFNMTLRDLYYLEKVLEKKISLGLDIGSSDNLLEFSRKIKPRNFAYSMGIDFFKKSFSIQKNPFKEIKNNIIKKLNKNNYFKSIFFNLADEGFKF